jgi:hypothetical protein
MHVVYIGNFRPEHSTENHVRQALEALGHTVATLQENDPTTWDHTRHVEPSHLLLWTRTGWEPPIPHGVQFELLDRYQRAGIPTVGFHLDRWWGLEREHQVHTEPFFRCSLVVTADGGHDLEWKEAGVNHHWMPPAVSEFECRLGSFDDAYASDVAFVGSWRPGYHSEWTHRPALIAHLDSWYGERFRCWPPDGQPAIRGAALRNLYASTRVNVGDSCLAGGQIRYWSDRIPETLGRGGFLIHPRVEGLGEHFRLGHHLLTWDAGDWDSLRHSIEWALSHPDEREQIRFQGREHVLEHHTYTVRMRQLLQEVGL